MIPDGYAVGAALGSWILTWLLHATLLLAAAVPVALAVRTRPELEEAVWKVALVGGLLTASLQPAVAGWKTAATAHQEAVVADLVPGEADSPARRDGARRLEPLPGAGADAQDR